MERYDIRVNIWGDVSGPQYEWEKVLATEGTFVLYADAQATVEALQEQLDHFGDTNKMVLAGDYETLAQLREATKVICGHCCEPMAIPSKAILQSQLTVLQGLVREFVEAWDHDGEPNAAAYESVVAKARAALPATPQEALNHPAQPESCQSKKEATVSEAHDMRENQIKSCLEDGLREARLENQTLRDERDRLRLRVKDLEKQVDRLEDAAIHAEEDF